MDDFKQSVTQCESTEGGGDAPSLSYADDAHSPSSVPKKKRKTRPLFECVEPSRQVRKLSKDPAYKSAYDAVASDARTLTLGALRKKYPGETNSHRGARGRRKKPGTPFDARLKDVRNWLIHLGPKPTPDHSAERIYRYEGYTPGNIEWLDKQGQTDNRCSTKWVEDLDGERLTIARFCDKHGIDYERNRKRHQRDWTVEQVLEAEGKSGVTGDPLADWRPPPHVLAHYKPQYDKRKKRGQIWIDWLIERLIGLQCKAKEAEQPDQVFSLGIQISTFKVDRRNLKVKRDAALYCQIQDELSLIASPPPKNNPLPNLPQPPPPKAPATNCIVVRTKKVDEPKVTPEQVLASIRKLSEK